MQSTQYDKIGKKYGSMADLPAIHPERPSVIAGLGDVKGLRCLDLACGLGRYSYLLHELGASSVTAFDISPAMVSAAEASYPSSTYPSISFAVADCSKTLPPGLQPSDVIFAGWFLNYASTEEELVSMMKIIEGNLNEGGRFVGITTNAHDANMREPKLGFYGLDILVLDEEYREPNGTEMLGIKARVRANTETPVEFDCFEFDAQVYERCAKKAGLKIDWTAPVVPDDERKQTDYWDRWLARPTFEIITAVKI
ncbi:S-adenosyl-L-methionine-dependent methyltransferase [Polyplosphaeria fusca]|uniref:S-adenosyl-L-methionine-dependent methyltransferase n=1 Tax=Polyplosphaeria fusca TaxID=682080 RepID=A0A9P4QJM4_9PLEO|nr:S-adenosyl-L-methionine-dependent methyltransferase [Polyplosphaeria fusca]